MRQIHKEVVSVTIPADEMEEIKKLNCDSYFTKLTGDEFKIYGVLGTRNVLKHRDIVYKFYHKRMLDVGKMENISTIVIASSFDAAIDMVRDLLWYKKVFKIEVESYTPIIGVEEI